MRRNKTKLKALSGSPAEHAADFQQARHDALSATQDASKALRSGKCLIAGKRIDEGYIAVGRMQANAQTGAEMAEASRVQAALEKADEPFETGCVRDEPVSGKVVHGLGAEADVPTYPYEVWATFQLRTTPEATVDIERGMVPPESQLLGTINLPFPYYQKDPNYARHWEWGTDHGEEKLNPLVAPLFGRSGFYLSDPVYFNSQIYAESGRGFIPGWEAEFMANDNTAFATVTIRPPMTYAGGGNNPQQTISTVPGLIEQAGFVVRKSKRKTKSIHGRPIERTTTKLVKVGKVKNPETLVKIDELLGQGLAAVPSIDPFLGTPQFTFEPSDFSELIVTFYPRDEGTPRLVPGVSRVMLTSPWAGRFNLWWWTPEVNAAGGIPIGTKDGQLGPTLRATQTSFVGETIFYGVLTPEAHSRFDVWLDSLREQGLVGIKDIPAGKPTEDEDERDFSELLTPEQRAAGYTLFTSESAHKDGAVRPSYLLYSSLFKDNTSVGRIVGAVRRDGYKTFVTADDTRLNPLHRRKGLGQKMYEALFRRGWELGATEVKGGVHSEDAHNVHEALATKHGWNYGAYELGVDDDGESSRQRGEDYSSYDYQLTGLKKVTDITNDVAVYRDAETNEYVARKKGHKDADYFSDMRSDAEETALVMAGVGPEKFDVNVRIEESGKAPRLVRVSAYWTVVRGRRVLRIPGGLRTNNVPSPWAQINKSELDEGSRLLQVVQKTHGVTWGPGSEGLEPKLEAHYLDESSMADVLVAFDTFASKTSPNLKGAGTAALIAASVPMGVPGVPFIGLGATNEELEAAAERYAQEHGSDEQDEDESDEPPLRWRPSGKQEVMEFQRAAAAAQQQFPNHTMVGNFPSFRALLQGEVPEAPGRLHQLVFIVGARQTRGAQKTPKAHMRAVQAFPVLMQRDTPTRTLELFILTAVQSNQTDLTTLTYTKFGSTPDAGQRVVEPVKAEPKPAAPKPVVKPTIGPGVTVRPRAKAVEPAAPPAAAEPTAAPAKTYNEMEREVLHPRAPRPPPAPRVAKDIMGPSELMRFEHARNENDVMLEVLFRVPRLEGTTGTARYLRAQEVVAGLPATLVLDNITLTRGSLFSLPDDTLVVSYRAAKVKGQYVPHHPTPEQQAANEMWLAYFTKKDQGAAQSMAPLDQQWPHRMVELAVISNTGPVTFRHWPLKEMVRVDAVGQQGEVPIALLREQAQRGVARIPVKAYGRQRDFVLDLDVQATDTLKAWLAKSANSGLGAVKSISNEGRYLRHIEFDQAKFSFNEDFSDNMTATDVVIGWGAALTFAATVRDSLISARATAKDIRARLARGDLLAFEVHFGARYNFAWVKLSPEDQQALSVWLDQAEEAGLSGVDDDGARQWARSLLANGIPNAAWFLESTKGAPGKEYEHLPFLYISGYRPVPMGFTFPEGTVIQKNEQGTRGVVRSPVALDPALVARLELTPMRAASIGSFLWTVLSDGRSLELSKDYGERARLIFKNPRGIWQASEFVIDVGPTGHTEAPTAEELVWEAFAAGYRTVGSGAVDNIMESLKGVKGLGAAPDKFRGITFTLDPEDFVSFEKATYNEVSRTPQRILVSTGGPNQIIWLQLDPWSAGHEYKVLSAFTPELRTNGVVRGVSSTNGVVRGVSNGLWPATHLSFQLKPEALARFQVWLDQQEEQGKLFGLNETRMWQKGDSLVFRDVMVRPRWSTWASPITHLQHARYLTLRPLEVYYDEQKTPTHISIMVDVSFVDPNSGHTFDVYAQEVTSMRRDNGELRIRASDTGAWHSMDFKLKESPELMVWLDQQREKAPLRFELT